MMNEVDGMKQNRLSDELDSSCTFSPHNNPALPGLPGIYLDYLVVRYRSPRKSRPCYSERTPFQRPNQTTEGKSSTQMTKVLKTKDGVGPFVAVWPLYTTT